MERSLFALLLFAGVEPLIVPYRYYLIQQLMNWNNARAYCKANYIDLAIIRNSEDLLHLQYKAQLQQFSSNAWIALYTEPNPWLWSMGKTKVGTITTWSTNQPDNWKGRELCGAIYGNVWNDKPCDNLLHFICFDATRTGNQRYIYLSLLKTWRDAQTYCRTLHTDLASARTPTENTVLAGLQSSMTWFGLYSESWVWPDRSNFTTPSWITGQPDNFVPPENCGYISNGLIADSACANTLPFFCYTIPSRKLMMVKVKVQCSQDVNDPLVKAAILDQIKIKIMTYGIAGYFTSKWKEQPDGNVFYKKEYPGNEVKASRLCGSN